MADVDEVKEEVVEVVEEVKVEVKEETAATTTTTSNNDSIKYLVQIVREVGIKNEAAPAAKQPEAAESKATPNADAPQVDKDKDKDGGGEQVVQELPKEPSPASEGGAVSSVAESQAPAPAPLARALSQETAVAPPPPQSALDFDLSNPIVPELSPPQSLLLPASPDETPVKEEAGAQLQARELPKSAESAESDKTTPETVQIEPRVLTRDLSKDVPASSEGAESDNKLEVEEAKPRRLTSPESSESDKKSGAEEIAPSLLTRGLPSEIPESDKQPETEKPEHQLQTRDLPSESVEQPEAEEIAPRLLARQLPRPATEPAELAAIVLETPVLAPAAAEQATPSSISYLVKIYKEANSLDASINVEPADKVKEKEQLGVAIEEISRNELEKLSLKPDDMSIKITEVAGSKSDDDDNGAKFAKDGNNDNNSTTYLVQIVKDAMSPAKAKAAQIITPSIIEAIKIETAVFVAAQDLPKKEADLRQQQPETIEHQVTVTTTTTSVANPEVAVPVAQPPMPILIQEVSDKSKLDFQVDESSSVTYLVQIVNDILSKPPRYPHETDTSIQPKPQEDLAIDRMNSHHLVAADQEVDNDYKLNELTTSQISDGVDSLINELNNQLVHQDLEHELTSNTMVESSEYDDGYGYDYDFGRPAPAKDVNLHEVAHDIVISAVSGAQNKSGMNQWSHQPSLNEFNKLGAVEYITRDQPIDLSLETVTGGDLPTFTASHQPHAYNVSVTKPTFTKGINEPQSASVAAGKDWDYHLTKPSLPAQPLYDAHVEAPSYSFSKDVSKQAEVKIPSMQQPTFSISHNVTVLPPVSVNVSKPPTFTNDYQINEPQPVSVAAGKDWNYSLTRPSIPAVPHVAVAGPSIQEPCIPCSQNVNIQPHVNVSQAPPFTKQYQINLQGPSIKEPQVSTSQDLDFSYTRPTVVPNYSFNNDANANVTVAGPSIHAPDYSFSKPEVNVKSEVKLPQFSLNKPSVEAVISPPFSLTSDHHSDDWSLGAEKPTKDLRQYGQPSVAGEVVINAGFAKPAHVETAQHVTSGYNDEFNPYEILRAYSTTSTEELLRNFNDELPGARQCRIVGDPASNAQFGVAYTNNGAGPYSISDVKPRAAQAGVREGDLIIAVNNVYVVGVTEHELIVQFLEAKKSNELLLELIEPTRCPVDVRSVISL